MPDPYVWTLGEFKPDLPPADNLTVCQNAYATSTGYSPVGAFAAFTPALPGLNGGGAFVASNNVGNLFAGTVNNLYRYSGVAWVSVLANFSAPRWRFAQFGDNLIAVNGSAVQTVNLKTGSAGALGGSPPFADLVGVIGDFVLLAGDPQNISRVTWSGFNNSTQWTAGTNQSDIDDLPDGGEIMGYGSGDQSGVILQRSAIRRIVYQGGDTIFAIGKITDNVGCMAKGSVAQAGRLVFFLSERGFHYTDGASEPVPIGFEKIDATFFKMYSRQDIEAGIYAAVDPRRNLVIWSMPGTPGTQWCYNYVLQRWTTVSTAISLVFAGFSSNVSLDALDARYGNLDAIPYSLDDERFKGGNPLLFTVDNNGTVGTMTGGALPALFSGARLNLNAGRARIRSARPVTDAPTATVTIAGRGRAADSSYARASGTMRANGSVPLRINAQQIEPTLQVSGAWTYAQGAYVDFAAGGMK